MATEDHVDLDRFYDVVLSLTKEAGEVIKSAFKQDHCVVMKSSEIDLVTKTDQEVEKLLIDKLKQEFPDHKFIGEETTAANPGSKCTLTDDPTWIIDPVDGTMNFVHGFPYVCISIGLLVKKEAVIGIVYNPVMDQLFTARKGKGAFLNGEPISVSKETDLGKALVLVEVGTSRDPDKMENVKKNLQALLPRVHGIRAMGSCALNMAMVAFGGADAYFEYGVHAWDMAAGDLLVREAGGVCTDPDGGAFDIMSRRMMCAASEALASQISPLLNHISPERD